MLEGVNQNPQEMGIQADHLSDVYTWGVLGMQGIVGC